MKSIDNFLDEQGRLCQFPARRKLKIAALFFFAEKFSPDRDYTEQQVNELLCAWHTFEDPATIRRELFGYGFLLRTPDGSCYRVKMPQPTKEELYKINTRI